jgi:hypothetical protein
VGLPHAEDVDANALSVERRSERMRGEAERTLLVLAGAERRDRVLAWKRPIAGRPSCRVVRLFPRRWRDAGYALGTFEPRRPLVGTRGHFIASPVARCDAKKSCQAGEFLGAA